MKPQVLSYGELLIDFSQHGTGPLGYPSYEALPGGGVANMVVALARWGHPAAFAGRVGDDALGQLLRRTLQDHGVDVGRLVSSDRPTTMAIVSNDAKGERSFDFLWKGTSCDGIPVAGPDRAAVPRVFHFSSVSMSDPEGRKNNLASARLHREAGSLVSFDPNLRTNLWSSLGEARSAIREGLALADLVKISEEEVAFTLDEPVGDPGDQGRRLRALYGPSVVFVTLGPLGCLWIGPDASGRQTALNVNAVDTTGAGDCFMAGALHVFLGQPKAPKDLSGAEVAAMAAFGVASGSLSTTRRGGIPSIPTLAEVEARLT
jgi:fructokinase